MTDAVPASVPDPASAPTPPASPRTRPSAALLAGLAVWVLTIAAVGYGLTGSPSLTGIGSSAGVASVDPAAVAGTGTADAMTPSREASMQQIGAMVDKLAARMKEHPDDAEGWVMLARSYMVLGRPAEAVPAYEKAGALRRNDAGLLVDWADAIATSNGGRATPESTDLVDRALKAEPTNLKALALAGSAAFDRGDFDAAIARWTQVGAALPADGELAKQVQASIAQARDQARRRSPVSVSVTAGADSAVSGTVTLAATLAAKAAPTDTVFVFARAASGSRVPLAVMRGKVADLPMRFRLDDSMAMGPMAKLSSVSRVIVGARISRSGDPMPHEGDLSGESAAVAPGTAGLAIEIGAPAKR